MAKKKKKKTSRRSNSNSEVDAWIDRETDTGSKCPLCESETLAELELLEARLRAKKKRVSMRAIWRRLTEKKLINISPDRTRKYLSRECHLKFYNYLKGLE